MRVSNLDIPGRGGRRLCVIRRYSIKGAHGVALQCNINDTVHIECGRLHWSQLDICRLRSTRFYLRHDGIDFLSTRSKSTARIRHLICFVADVSCWVLLLVHQLPTSIPSLTAGLGRFRSDLIPPRMQHGESCYLDTTGLVLATDISFPRRM